MRTITMEQFLEYIQNAWLAGFDMNEVCFQLIVFHDIEITPRMELKLEAFFISREKQMNAFIPTLDSELRGH